MKTRKLSSMLMVTLLLIPSFASVYGDSALSVETVGDDFEPGDPVNIYGTASVNSTVQVIIIYNGTYTLLDTNLTTLQDGNFSITYPLSEEAGSGIYNVSVFSSEDEAFTLFTVEVEEPEVEDEEPGNETVPEPIEDSTEENATETLEYDLEDGEDLDSAIARAEAYLEKIRVSITNLYEEHSENEDVTTKLDEISRLLGFTGEEDGAEDFLRKASEALNDGDHRTAARYLAVARSLMGRIKGLLNSVMKAHKISRIEKFQKQVESRIEGLQAKIGKLRGSLSNGQEALTALNATKLKMNNINKVLKAGNSSAAMEYLEDVINDIETNLDSLNGTETSVQFKKMNRLEAKIRSLKATAKRLEKKGLNATSVFESISFAENQLSQITGQFEKGNKKSVFAGSVVSGNANGSGNGNSTKGVIKGYLKPKKTEKGRPSWIGPKKDE